MFVNICPTNEHVGETLSSLKFAKRVGKVELGSAKAQVKKSRSRKVNIFFAFYFSSEEYLFSEGTMESMRPSDRRKLKVSIYFSMLSTWNSFPIFRNRKRTNICIDTLHERSLLDTNIKLVKPINEKEREIDLIIINLITSFPF